MFGVAFAPDGHILATASADGTVRLRNVANVFDVGYPQGYWSHGRWSNGRAKFRTRYTPTDAAMLRKNTIIELMALPMNAPVWAGLGMMKTKIKMRMSSVRSHLGMHLDCPPHASGARPCAGVVAEGIQLVRGGCDVRMTSRGRPSHRTRCCTTLDGRFLEHGASVHLDMAGGRP